MTTQTVKVDAGNHYRSFAYLLKSSGLFWALALLCVIASFISPDFLGHANLVNVLRQMALAGIVGVGMTFVIITAGIDISIGSIIGVVGVISAMMLGHGVSVPLVVVCGLLVGAVLGVLNGLGITLGRVPPFIMTLGMMVAARGFAMTLSGGQPVDASAAADFAWLGWGNLMGVPVPVVVFALVCAVSYIVLKYTAFGRAIYAVGSNHEAARLSGINVRFTTLAVYVISGLLAGVTALILVSRLTVGEPTLGTGQELEAITIAVIGGASLFGGEGGVVGTVIGAAVLAVLANIMNLIGVSPFTQQIVKGLIIIIAVLLEMRKLRK
ncbi:ABC transporter permease [Paraburkholderia sp. HD33-4]|uniref:ABC transporter permease n=1 Tax=Paraburkholderia sp. HD33-4 TaxID=2883242 RepID=UPI001F37FDA5|nr:ABC transporter permease [Paraburkholderia sp. HD33-4]